MKKAGNIPPMDSLHEFSLIIRYNWNSSFLITSFQVKLSGRAPPLVIFLPRWKYFIIVRDRFFLFFFLKINGITFTSGYCNKRKHNCTIFRFSYEFPRRGEEIQKRPSKRWVTRAYAHSRNAFLSRGKFKIINCNTRLLSQYGRVSGRVSHPTNCNQPT